MTRPVRVTVLTSHPIQYFAPLFERLAARAELDLTVLYCSTVGVATGAPAMQNFGQPVVWDVDLLSGYRHRFLRAVGPADPDRPRSVLNPGIAWELARRRPEVLVSFGWAYPTNWLGFLAARATRTPLLLYGDTDVRGGATGWRGAVRRRVLAGLCRSAAGALYVGTFNRDFYVRHGMSPERLWFSPFAVDTERFQAVDRAAARRRLGLDSDVCYFLFAGALIERKRPAALLRAVAALQAEGHRVGAIVAGTGPLEPELRRIVERRPVANAHLLGFVNQREIPAVYAAADAFVLPSARDPRGLVVNEAMSAGLPVAVSTGSGVWGPGDLVRDGEEGLVFPPDDDALTQALRLLSRPDVRARLGSSGARRVQELGYDRAVEGWLEAVNAVARGGRWGRRWPAPAEADR